MVLDVDSVCLTLGLDPKVFPLKNVLMILIELKTFHLLCSFYVRREILLCWKSDQPPTATS